jgi:hypothetical protein
MAGETPANPAALASSNDPQCIQGEDRHSPDAPWLADQPEQPLQACAPHPRRRPRHPTRQVIEGAADADRHSGPKSIAHAVDPELLPRMSVRDEEHLRTMACDQRKRLGI